MTAVISTPMEMASGVYAQLGGRALPTKVGVGRVYFLAPLFTLSGTGLFNQPEIDIQYFETQAEAAAWGEADIQRRMDEQRAVVRAMVLDGVRGRQAKEL